MKTNGKQIAEDIRIKEYWTKKDKQDSKNISILECLKRIIKIK